MNNPVIKKSWASIRRNKWAAATAIVTSFASLVLWLLGELTKHRLFAWLNSRIDEESGTILRFLWVPTSWVITHPVQFGLIIAAGYCVIVITYAQVEVIQEKRQSAQSRKLGELGFVHLGEQLGHRWRPSIKGTVMPPILLLPDAPFSNSVAIEGRWDPGIDCNVEAYLTLGNRLKYAARFSGHTAVYTNVRVLASDGSRQQRWLQHVLGGEDEPIDDTDMQAERKIYVSGTPLKDGWLTFDFFLPDEVRRAYAGEGFVYSALLEIRLRGALSISPIEVYRD